MEWSDCCLRHSVCIWREGYRQTFSLFMRTLSNSYVLMTYSRFKCLNKAPSIHWFSSAYPVQGCRVDGAYLSCHRARGGIHPGQTLTFTPLSKAGVPGESPHRCEENMQTPLVFTDFFKKISFFFILFFNVTNVSQCDFSHSLGWFGSALLEKTASRTFYTGTVTYQRVYHRNLAIPCAPHICQL